MVARDDRSGGRLAPALERRLSPFPPIAIRVLQLLEDDEASVGELVELIRSDPAFSAEMLKRANSPLFSASRFGSPVVSLNQAMILLGFRRIRSLALTVAAGLHLRKVAEVDELRRFWRYSLACALLAEELAKAFALPQDLAYTAGLLHDVGRLGLMVAHPHQYAQLMRHAAERLEAGEPVDIADLERDLFGIDHYEAGRRLAEEWKLPSPLPEIAGRHPWRVMQSWDLVGVVRLGCQLAIALGFAVLPSPHNPSVEAILAELPEPVRNRLPGDPWGLGEEIRRRIAELDIESFSGPETAGQCARQTPPATAGTLPAAEAHELPGRASAEPDGKAGISSMVGWLVAASAFAALLLLVLLKLLP